MFKKNLVFLVLVVLLANMAFAVRKDGSYRPAGPGFWAAALLGVQVLVGRIRVRTEPAEEANGLLLQMQQLLDRMRTMELDPMRTALVQIEALQRDYLAFIREYRVNEDALGPQQAAGFVEEARRLVVVSQASHVTPARYGNVPDVRNDDDAEMSPTAARLSGGLETVLVRADETVASELRPLVAGLLAAQEDAAQRVEQQIQQLLTGFEVREHRDEEIMALRGAVQQILRVLEHGPLIAPLPMVPNNGELLPSLPNIIEPNTGALLGSDDEENDGRLLPSDDDE